MAADSARTLRTLYLYVIHEQSLTQRALHIHGVIQQLRVAAMEKGWDVRIDLIVKHDNAEVTARQSELAEKITYESCGDAEFDKYRQLLTLEALGNMEKHKEAWTRIIKAEPTTQESLFMVIEDDLLILPGGIANFAELLVKAPEGGWDVIFPGIATGATTSMDFQLLPLAPTIGTSIPAKESYIVRPAIAKMLVDYTNNDKIRFTMRHTLSYFLAKVAPTLRAVHPSRRIFIDGSKIGTFPSSVHANNILVFNHEYMQLLEYMTKDKNTILANMDKVNAVYRGVEHLQSPDMMHIFGVILYKAGMVKRAEEILTAAMKTMREKQGVLNGRSDLMNNLISIYQFIQPDLDDCAKATSYYDDPKMAEPAFA